MRRRTFLTVTASATALTAVAGCTQNGDRGTTESTDTDGSADNPGSQPGGTNTTDADETTRRETEIGTIEDGSSDSSGGTDQSWGSSGEMNGVPFSFSSQSPECGEGNDDVDISFDDDAGEIVLDGVIRGSDLCKRARLESVEHDESADKLRVEIGTVDREQCQDGDMAAGQCLVDIEYEATFSFEGEIPSEASVNHGDRFSAGAGYASESVSAPTETETESQ